MCGRYALARDADEIAAAFNADAAPLRSVHRPRYNICPTDTVPVIIAARDGRRVGPMRWGIPAAARGRGRRRSPSLLINARSETAARLPAFRDSFRARRCLAPADGFYEWESRPSGKQPHWIHRESGKLVALAGIWRYAAAGGRGDPVRTVQTGDPVRPADLVRTADAPDPGPAPRPPRQAAFAVLTRAAPPSLQWLHARVPVILPESAWDAWLAPATDLRTLARLVAAADPPLLRTHPVSRAVNRPGYDRPDCIAPIDPE